MKNRHILWLFLLFLAGCESYWNYPAVEDVGKLYLECFPGTGEDSTVLILSRAHPVNRPAGRLSLDQVRVGLSVNASPVEWASCREVEGGLRFVAPTTLSEGDAVALTVQDAEEAPVRSVSLVPPGPSFSYSRELTSEWRDRYHIMLETEMLASGRSFYGVSLEALAHNTITQKDGSKVVEIVPFADLRYEMKEGESAPVSLGNRVEGRFHPVSSAGKGLIVFEVDESDPSPCELVLETPNIGYHYVWARPGVVALQCVYYRLVVYRLAPDTYRFLNPQENISLIGAGLVPPFSAQGNLQGVFGMFECVGRSVTEWLPGLGL